MNFFPQTLRSSITTWHNFWSTNSKQSMGETLLTTLQNRGIGVRDTRDLCPDAGSEV
jgi:hypothetical protein